MALVTCLRNARKSATDELLIVGVESVGLDVDSLAVESEVTLVVGSSEVAHRVQSQF